MDPVTQQILDTRQRVDAWVSRGRLVEDPQPGSELAEDNKTWPVLGAAEVTRRALLAATEHLQLVGETVERRRLYASALHTPLRGALLGAATAVWVVGPDDATERRQRALRVATEFYRRMAQRDSMLMSVCPADQRHLLNEQIEHSTMRESECRQLWGPTATLSAKERPEDTNVIHRVADTLFADDTGKSASIKVQWAELSGDAHALGWQLLARRTAPMTRHPSGLRSTAVLSQIEHLGEPYLAAYAVLQRGWSFFDQRCTGP